MSEEVEKVLVPQVQWAQRKQMIILRVLVKPVEASQVLLENIFKNFIVCIVCIFQPPPSESRLYHKKGLHDF